MKERPRIDLDGVPLTDEANPHMVLAIFRYRTTEGLILLIPESAEVVVPWGEVEAAELDLRSGLLRVGLKSDYVASQNWLRGAKQLTGRWTDRFVMR
jgi:hypothetical protein